MPVPLRCQVYFVKGVILVSAIKDAYKELGVRLFGYSDEYGQKIMKNYKLRDIAEEAEGFATCINNHYVVFYDDTVHEQSQEFTLLHELGHIFAGHLVTPYKNESAELEADVFATTILALRWYEKIFKRHTVAMA